MFIQAFFAILKIKTVLVSYEQMIQKKNEIIVTLLLSVTVESVDHIV